MAAQITHILAGEEALRRADPAMAEALLDEEGPWFRLGCQGPDIFYHNQRTKPSGLHYGSLAHRRNYGLILEGALPALPPEEAAGSARARAYLLGMATHAALDRATHPFIVCFAGWPSPPDPASERFRSCHPFLERILDVGLLSSLRGVEPSAYDVAAALPAAKGEGIEASEPEIVALWAAGLRAAYPRQAGGDLLLERRVANALADALYFYSVTNPAATAMNRDREAWFAYLGDSAGYRSVALVYPESLPKGIDPMNLERASWPHPAGDGRTSTSSYPELVEEGIDGAAAAIRAILPALRGEKAPEGLAEALGLGSLSIADPSGDAVVPRVARPLPLARLMEEEYAKRLEWIRR